MPALDDAQRANLAASFQRAATAGILRNVAAALDLHAVPTLLVGGGASANSRLRAELAALCEARGVDLRLPPMRWCIDNAAMIAGFAAHRVRRGESDPLGLAPQPLSAFR